MAPKILFMGKLLWAHKECQELLGSHVAEILPLEVKSREELFEAFKPSGKYGDIVGGFYEGSVKPIIGFPDADFFKAVPESFKWLAWKGAGYDPVDTAAAKARNIAISNTPGAVDEATATTAVYLLISTMRNFTWAERHVRAGKFAPMPELEAKSHDLSGKTLGILGLGGIGSTFCNYMRPYGMRILYHNRKPSSLAPEGVEYVGDLYEMLRQVDVLSVHMPLSAKTQGFVGEKEIRTMKKGSIIINTARGKVIDQEAMIKALQDEHLASVGLDVFPEEPKVDQRLLDMPNITLLPHVGTENQDARRKMEVVALTNLRDYLTKGRGPNLIPECQ